MRMVEKIKKYERRINGNNAFAIAVLVDPQLWLDHIGTVDYETVLNDIR